MNTKKIFAVSALIGMLGVAAQPAGAEITGLSLRFGGGCTSGNHDRSCILKVTASGTDLAGSEGVQLYEADDLEKPFTRVSNRIRALSSDGRATYRVRNNAGGCYQVRTAPNGNNKRDYSSHKICE